MWREIEPDERIEIDVEGYKVVAYSFGSGAETVLLSQWRARPAL
jgi:proline iminopeptidase